MIVVPLAVRLMAPSDRTTSWTFLYQDLKELEAWGPLLESLQVLTVTKNRTANHVWKVVAIWSNDGVTAKTPFTDLSSELDADDQTIEAAVTSGFGGRVLKFAIAVKNATGTELETAVVSAWLVCTFKT